MICQLYSMQVVHPLGWYIMCRPWLHVQPWFSLPSSSMCLGECSQRSSLLDEPLGSSLLLLFAWCWPFRPSPSPGSRGWSLMYFSAFVSVSGGGCNAKKTLNSTLNSTTLYRFLTQSFPSPSIDSPRSSNHALIVDSLLVTSLSLFLVVPAIP
jgi:hypothetical protein